MKSLPKALKKSLTDAGYTRTELYPRTVTVPVIDPDGAIVLQEDGKPQVEKLTRQDLFVWPGNLKDEHTHNWPALHIIGEAGADYDEAQEVANGALRIRNLRLEGGEDGSSEIEDGGSPITPAHTGDPDPAAELIVN